MIKNISCKTFSAMLCMLLVAGMMLTGCSGDKSTASKASGLEATKEEVKADNTTKYVSGAGAMAGKKEETVNIKAKADGTIKKIKVTDYLKDFEAGKLISDISNLKDIRNVSGDEKMYPQKDGTFLWENSGEDIKYEGKSEEKLPVDVKVSYYLDGKKMPIEQISGKSGKVKIRYDYKNRTSKTEEVDGKKYKVNVPFVFLTMVTLDDDVFKNVKIKNGEVYDMDNNTMALGFGMPGVGDALGLDEFEDDLEEMKDDKDKKSDKDEKFPDYVEITADVKDFELDFSTTIVTKGIFGGLDNDMFKNLRDVSKSMKKLQKATNKLEDATEKVYDGSKKLGDGVSQYVDGVKKVNSGVSKLKAGSGKLDANSAKLVKGQSALTSGLRQLKTGLDKMDMSGYASIPSMKPLVAAIAGLKQGVAGLLKGSEGMEKGIKGYTAGVSGINKGIKGLSAGMGKLASSGNKLVSGFNAFENGLRKLADGMSDYNEDGIKNLTKFGGEDLKKIANRLNALKKADKGYGTFSGAFEGQDTTVQFLFEMEGDQPDDKK
ncbi:hypothetical protein [Eubacterium xylanophilum]|uniref:hypothetical protein n=1 Tax=Eubacterium xylanophilum TaxID=39497 RepID=UPI00047DAF38|nr:hypothetical protein [Eubacterium xylanophilum]